MEWLKFVWEIVLPGMAIVAFLIMPFAVGVIFVLIRWVFPILFK